MRGEDDFVWEKNVIGYHREQAVEEHLASGEKGIVALVSGYQKHRIECPAETGHKSQGIAQG